MKNEKIVRQHTCDEIECLGLHVSLWTSIPSAMHSSKPKPGPQGTTLLHSFARLKPMSVDGKTVDRVGGAAASKQIDGFDKAAGVFCRDTEGELARAQKGVLQITCSLPHSSRL